jgi:hypothetical protein
VTEVVTDSDREPGAGATATSNDGAVTFGPRKPPLARARDTAEPTRRARDAATADAERDADDDRLRAEEDALRGFYAAIAGAGGAFRTALAGPAAWPLIIRDNPSVARVWRQGREYRAWDSPSLAYRWAVRAFWIADALWETALMILRVWWRTRITWAITILILIAWIVWGH